jgi:hypothetical protein
MDAVKGCVTLLVIAVLVFLAIGVYNRLGGNEAQDPEPEWTHPPLEEATVYVQGSEGGSFILEWADTAPSSIKGRKEGVIAN